ncbi:MAG: hypothetical protein U9N73_05455 [Candidatus Auribacterota bacterium]|nr:hypothetical protein [Candidatus Auribacterota bacterium]
MAKPAFSQRRHPGVYLRGAAVQWLSGRLSSLPPLLCAGGWRGAGIGGVFATD